MSLNPKGIPRSIHEQSRVRPYAEVSVEVFVIIGVGWMRG